MSWNLIVLPREDLDGDDLGTLGKASEVRACVEKFLSPVDWSDPKMGVYEGKDFRIEIALQEVGEVESFMLHVTGTSDAPRVVFELCLAHEWNVFDSVAGEYLDPRNPSDQGWKGYLAHVGGKVVPPEED